MIERDLAADRELTADDLLATALTFHQRPRTPLGGEQLGDELIALRRACDLLELEFSELAARFADTNQYEEDGTTSPIDWIRHNCRMTGNAAADRVVVGEQRFRLPESCESLARGDIGFAHLSLMAHTADALMRPAWKCAFDEATLLEKAELSSAGRFRHICHHARHAVDAEAFAEDEKFQAEQRFLKLTPGAEGCLFIEGALAPRAARWCAPAWSRWQSARGWATTATGPGGWPTLWWRWPTTAWTPASCLRPAASVPTST